MNKLNLMVVLVAVGLVVMAALAACGSSQTQAPTGAPASDGATLLETRCSTACHNADKAKQASLTAEQWDQTVTRMIAKGAKLTDAEKAMLVEYLAKTYGP